MLTWPTVDSMTQDRDGLTIGNQHILHATARRDWICGTCGGKLTTRWFDDAPNWRTVCMTDDGHEASEFVHSGAWAYIQARRQMDTIKAGDVFEHLPAELRAAILAAK